MNYFILKHGSFTTMISIDFAWTVHKSFTIMFSNWASWCYPGYDRCLSVLSISQVTS